MLFDNLKKCFLDEPNLTYDEACLDIVNMLNTSITILGQYVECHKCIFQKLTTVKPFKNTSIVVNTRFPMEIYYEVKGNPNIHCPLKRLLYEHYRYGWNITEECPPIYLKQPANNAYLPILMAFVILFCFGTIWYMVKCIYKNWGRLTRYLICNSEIQEDLSASSAKPIVIERASSVHKHPNRIKSIDVFRGLCIMLMIFVNYGGGKYWFFEHSVWNGITIADLVFPWFLWLVGLSLTISLQSRSRRASPRRQIIFHIICRSVILIFLGFIINSNRNTSTFADLRFPGVLQRIGITYLVVGSLEVIFIKRTEIDNVFCIHDVATAWPQWLLIICIAIIHTCVTFLVDVPGCGKGYLGPGGLDDFGKFPNCTGGVAGYIDRAVFGNHMYKTPPCQNLYETTEHYDSGGILGTLTSIITVYFGVQAGRILITYQNVQAKIIRWVIWGLATGLLGGIMCSFSRDDGPIPLNKQLLSLSFVLVTSGMAFIVLAFLFVIVDISRKWGGRPFFYPGTNALVLYVGHELMRNTFPFAWKPPITHATYLFMNLWGTFLWVAISIFLHKKNIFITL